MEVKAAKGIVHSIKRSPIPGGGSRSSTTERQARMRLIGRWTLAENVFEDSLPTPQLMGILTSQVITLGVLLDWPELCGSFCHAETLGGLGEDYGG
jgi:hypothetical protein